MEKLPQTYALVFLFFLFSFYQSFGQCVTCGSDAGTSGCTITLSGAVSNPTYTLNSSSDKLCIAAGATITGNWNITITDPGAMIVNNGSIDVDNNVEVEDGLFINNGELSVGGDLEISGGQMVNYNLLTVSGDFNLSDPDAEFCNQDSINISNDALLSGDFLNGGVLVVDNTFRQDTGNICVEAVGKVYTMDFEVNGNIIGPSPGDGCAYFDVSSSSTVDASGSLTGMIDFCDQTPPLTSPYIDVFTGSIDTNVMYCGCLTLLSLEARILEFSLSNSEEDQNILGLAASILMDRGSYHLFVEVSKDDKTYYKIHSESLKQESSGLNNWSSQTSLSKLVGFKWIRLVVAGSSGKTFSKPISIKDLQSQNPYQVWLSASRILRIRADVSPSSRLRVLGMNGKKVFESWLNTEEFSQSFQLPKHIPSGLYQVYILSPHGQSTHRIWLK
ncbi:MAG: hypothetical protein MRZ79_21525 [Bacteroidia bacterium]|nr:hypothetical protein [Bacteroidia bacterium]